jgi:hypothetical protein
MEKTENSEEIKMLKQNKNTTKNNFCKTVLGKRLQVLNIFAQVTEMNKLAANGLVLTTELHSTGRECVISADPK